MFNKESLDRCKMSLEDWTKPLFELPKGETYLIGSFNLGKVITLVFYKDVIFYFANEDSTQRVDHYNFPNLQRAYAYFEQMFYG